MRQICMRDKIRDASKVLLVISEISRRSTEIWAVDPIREERFFREGCKASQKTPKLKSDCAIALGTGAIHVLLEPNPLDRFHHGRYWHCSGLGCILKGARCEVQVRLEFGNIQQNASKMCLQLKIISKTHPIFLQLFFFLPPILTNICSSKMFFPQFSNCENYIKIFETHRRFQLLPVVIMRILGFKIAPH